MKHKHRAIPNHSPQQAAMFFALASQLQFNEEEVKKRATKKFKHECFNDITSGEINWLIEQLLKKTEKRKSGG